MKIFADSSFLVACYVLEVHSDQAAALFRKHAREITICDLAVVEVSCAICAQVFRRHLANALASRALSAFDEDVATEMYRLRPMPARCWSHGAELARKHSATRGVRTLDILHVAAALGLGATSFFTFDKRQAALARAEGLLTPIEIA